MTFTANQELTTSITNLINSIITFFLLMNVLHLKKEKEGKLLWIITFGLFLISSFAGAAVHGIVLNSDVKRICPKCRSSFVLSSPSFKTIRE